ncbi:MAG: pantoate--beta-alanine ligase [SAR324 cluster bacterium]|nr:pantoate--beta-alanine ligase [SAR324 cluster bacterium]
MRILQNTHDLANFCHKSPRILIPTMGALHEGHLALVERARHIVNLKKQDIKIIVSIFINPLQMESEQDFKKYPRQLQDDYNKLSQSSVDAVFIPLTKDIYPEKQTFLLSPPASLSSILEGEFRPNFFEGVSTVVLKLFNIVMPKFAVFGKKDYQQMLVIKEMIRQFNLDIKILSVDTLRDKRGLALSSRNLLLSADDLINASFLFECLDQIKNLLLKGNDDFDKLARDAVAKLINNGWQPDYITIRNPINLAPAMVNDNYFVVLGAAHFKGVRLIDNILFKLP